MKQTFTFRSQVELFFCPCSCLATDVRQAIQISSELINGRLGEHFGKHNPALTCYKVKEKSRRGFLLSLLERLLPGAKYCSMSNTEALLSSLIVCS